MIRRVGLLLLLPFYSLSQQDYLELASQRANIYQQKEAFEAYWSSRTPERGKGYKPFLRYLNFMEPRVFPSGELPDPAHNIREYRKLMSHQPMSPQRNGNWQPVGPSTWSPSGSWNPGIGRVNCLAISPVDSSLMLLGAAAGGIWRSTDAGQNWTPVGDNFALLGISGICFDPDEPQTLYAATGDGDGFSTHGFGVITSSDGGQTWQTTSLAWNTNAFTTCREVKVSPHDKESVYAVTNKGLFKSTDKGATWTWVNKPECRDVEFHPTDPDVVYATSSDHFYRSEDGGESFTIVTTGMPDASEVSRMEIAVSQDNPNAVYVIGANQSTQGLKAIWLSTDQGQSFNIKTDSPNLLGYSTNGTDLGGQGWYDLAFVVDPEDWQHVLVGGINVWETTDGGDNWQQIAYWLYPNATGYCHADVHRLYLSDHQVFACSDGGIYSMDRLSGLWTDLTHGIQISQFYKVDVAQYDNEVMLASAQDNGTILRDSLGTYQAVVGADGMESSIHPWNPNVMFCTYQFGGLMVSTDGGGNFAYVDVHGGTESGAWETPHMYHSNGTFYIGYQSLWKSTDNGVSFTKMGDINSFNPGQIKEFDVSVSNPNVIYASKNEEMFVSLNGGNSWSDASNGLPNLAITGIAIHPVLASTVYITMSGYIEGEKVYMSSDYGQSWQNISRNFPNIPLNCVAHRMGQSGLQTYVGTDIGVMVLDQQYANWVPFSSDLPNVVVNDLEMVESSGKVVAATYGRGLWISDFADFSDEIPVADFLANNTRVCAGQPVTFTDASTFAPDMRAWNFAGGTPSVSYSYQQDVTYSSPGVYDVSLSTSNANGTDLANKPSYITVFSPTAYQTPYVQDFEVLMTFDDGDISIENPDGISTWQLTTLTSPLSDRCAWLSNEQHMPNNSDFLVGPPIDISGSPALALGFKYSFSKKNDLSSDILKVHFSYDCGATWGLALQISTDDLATALEQPQTFAPASYSQWARAVIPLDAGGAGFRYKFEFISGGGNNIYLDDIMVSEDAGISENPASAITVFPNPSSDVFNIRSEGDIQVDVLNTLGQKVMDDAGKDLLTLDMGDQPAGLYLLRVVVNGRITTHRVFLEK